MYQPCLIYTLTPQPPPETIDPRYNTKRTFEPRGLYSLNSSLYTALIMYICFPDTNLLPDCFTIRWINQARKRDLWALLSRLYCATRALRKSCQSASEFSHRVLICMHTRVRGVTKRERNSSVDTSCRWCSTRSWIVIRAEYIVSPRLVLQGEIRWFFGDLGTTTISQCLKE